MGKARTPRAWLQLRLYVAGNSPNSQLALVNSRALCAEHFPDAHEIEIIDLLASPARAAADGIIVTPTLIKVSPLPAQRLVGNLSDATKVLAALLAK